MSILMASGGFTAYAYTHPKTLARVGANMFPGAVYFQFGRSASKWIPTTLMPEECMIYSPNLMPGMEWRAKQ